MFVKSRMTGNPFTISSGDTAPMAVEMMEQHRVRHLPVVDDGRLVGIISHGDIAEAGPSKTTTLSAGELQYLWNKLTVGKVMTRDPLTIDPHALLETAAGLMRDNKIEILPVLDGDQLVGVITESDIVDSYLELLGCRDHGARLAIEAVDAPGVLSELTAITARYGANITHLAVFRGAGLSTVLLGLNTHNTGQIEDDMTAAGFRVIQRIENR